MAFLAGTDARLEGGRYKCTVHRSFAELGWLDRSEGGAV
jgi:hypothetical protein